MTSEITTLGNVLANAHKFNAGYFLYLPMDEVWQLDTRCAVLPVSDADGVPDLALQNGLSYALGIDAVHEVFANAQEQVGNVGPDQLLQAFLFFYDRDAFINFEDSSRHPGSD